MLEILIVIAIIGILSALVLIQIDPARRIHRANNATRWGDVLSILEGVKRYQADNDSTLPATAVAVDNDDTTVQIIGENVTNCTCTGQSVKSAPCGVSGLDIDIRTYMAAIPYDPITGSQNDTRYYINIDQYELITVGACDAEGQNPGGKGPPPDITITR